MEPVILSAIRWWAQAAAVFFAILCVVLIIVILLQKGRGSGLSAAFGGAGGQSAFGSKTGDVFTWVTIVIVGTFLLLAMILTRVYVPYSEEDQIPSFSSVPASTAPPAPRPTGQMPTGPARTAPATVPPAAPPTGPGPAAPAAPPTRATPQGADAAKTEEGGQ